MVEAPFVKLQLLLSVAADEKHSLNFPPGTAAQYYF